MYVSILLLIKLIMSSEFLISV